MPADDVTTIIGGLCYQVEGTGFAWGPADVMAMTAGQAERFMGYLGERAEQIKKLRKG